MATSEPASPLIAGVVSFKGLIPIFGTTGINGTTAETDIGIMTIPSYNDWVSRLNSSVYQSTGPTGAWAGEWWAVYNYLQYGGGCLVGGTGTTGDYYGGVGGVLTASNTPLHNKSISSFDVVFDAGNTFLLKQHIVLLRPDEIVLHTLEIIRVLLVFLWEQLILVKLQTLV